MQRTLVGLLLLTVLLTACQPIQPVAPQAAVNTTAAAPPVAAGLRVEVNQSLGAISPYIFGTNYGPWVSLRPETLPLAEVGGFRLLRYPGGEWGDKNKLQTYQIDQLVNLARRLGAEPYIHVRLPGSSPAEAAETVRYANVQKKYQIKFWAIGNEPSLYAGNAPGKGWVKEAVWDTVYYNQQWRQFAEAMRAVDPAIQLIGPEIHQWSNQPGVAPQDPSGRDWLTEFLKANGDLVDIVAIHRYPFPNNADNTPAQIADLRANPVEWDAIIPALRTLINETTGRDIPIGVTEINSHWSGTSGGEATPDSFYNAIWWGDVLGRMINQRVDYVAQFILTGNTFALLDKYAPRPGYYTYLMYKPLGDQLLASSSSAAEVSITAARRTTDGALTLVIVNRGAAQKRLPLQGVTTPPQQAWLFDQTHSAAEVAPAELTEMEGADLFVTLPGQSLVTLVFAAAP